MLPQIDKEFPKLIFPVLSNTLAYGYGKREFTAKSRFEYKFLVLSLYIINIEFIKKNIKNILKKLMK